MKVYTLGYEKRNIHEYLEVLKEANVKILIDVRERAWSYKRDFCKVKFSSALNAENIHYIHIKELGNPKEIRHSGHEHHEILRQYKSYLRKTKAGIDDLFEIFQHAKKHKYSICLTCYERNFQSCHRSIITDYVYPKVKGLKVVHL